MMEQLDNGRRSHEKALVLSTSMCALARSLAHAMPGTATGAGARPAFRAGHTTFPDRLYGVKATSASDVRTVGFARTSSLIVHWNGRAWSQSISARRRLPAAAGHTPVIGRIGANVRLGFAGNLITSEKIIRNGRVAIAHEQHNAGGAGPGVFREHHHERRGAR